MSTSGLLPASVHQVSGLSTANAIDDREPLRSPRRSVLVGLVPLVPSPALATGLWILIPPLVLAALVVDLWRASRESRGFRTIDVWVLLVGLLYIAGAAIDEGPDRFPRVVARALTVATIVSVSAYSRLEVRARDQLLRSYCAGATVAAAIAVGSAVFDVSPFGAELKPGRPFLIGIDVAKTTGVARSFGEFGVILAGGWVARTTIRNLSLRLTSSALILAGAVVAQSRNVLLTMAAVVGLTWIASKFRTTQPMVAAIAVVALLSPLMVQQAINVSDTVTERFVGSGIYAANVEGRFDQVGLYTDWLAANPVGAMGLDGMTRAEWAEISEAAPHNHFLSLLVFDGLIGLVVLAGWWGVAFFRAAEANPLRLPEIRWLLAVVIGLSFYEGAFSPSVAIALGLVFGRTGSFSPDFDYNFNRSRNEMEVGQLGLLQQSSSSSLGKNRR